MLVDASGNRLLDSNSDFISDIMLLSDYGPVAQVFVVEALRYYSELILKTPVPEDLPEMPINPRIWHATAFEVFNKINTRFGTGDDSPSEASATENVPTVQAEAQQG